MHSAQMEFGYVHWEDWGLIWKCVDMLLQPIRLLNEAILFLFLVVYSKLISGQLSDNATLNFEIN